jgi:hypothetical protein
MIVKISAKKSPEANKKELDKLAKIRGKKKKKLSDFYGKMPGVFGNGLSYQKKIRDEWS